MPDRSDVVSSFTIIKGSLIDETFSVFQRWDFDLTRTENLRRVREFNTIGASSASWARDVAKVLNRRFDPDGRDRTLVELAQRNCDREIWKPLLLWHMTRDEFLLRDFLVNWVFEEHRQGTFHLRTEDVAGYLKSLSSRRDIDWAGEWQEATRSRVASGLLRIATDFGLLKGTQSREFASYHLPDESFLYLLHAMAADEANPRRIVDSHDWRMFLMDASDVERELLRLHQYRKVHFERAGSLAELRLPYSSAHDFAKELCA